MTTVTDGNTKALKRTIYWLLLLLWLALAVYLSRQTGEQTADFSGGLTEWLAGLLARIGIAVELEPLHDVMRRCAHVFIYLVLGFLACRVFCLSFSGKWVIAAVFLFCFAVGVLDEYQKAFIPGRHCHWNDVLVNCICGAVGVIIGLLVRRVRKKNAEN